MWEELGWLFEEGLDGVVEASEVGIGGSSHGGVVSRCWRLLDVYICYCMCVSGDCGGLSMLELVW